MKRALALNIWALNGSMGFLIQTDEFAANGKPHESGNIKYIKPGHNMGTVGFNCLNTNVHAFGYLSC